MPSNGPGLRHDTIATKAVLHGDPVVENGFPGVAFKNTQLTAFIDPLSTSAKTIAVDEPFTVVVGGMVEVRAAKFPGGMAAGLAGQLVYIQESDNSLLTGAQTIAEGVDEVQTLTITGGVTGGTFPITFNTQTTTQLAWNASAATVQTALEALSNVDPGDIVVTGSAGGPWTLTFHGQYENINVPQITSSAAALTGGTPVITPATTTSGSSAGLYKYGRVDGPNVARQTVRINTNARDTF